MCQVNIITAFGESGSTLTQLHMFDFLKVYLLLTHAILACNEPDAGEISNIRMVVGKNENG